MQTIGSMIMLRSRTIAIGVSVAAMLTVNISGVFAEDEGGAGAAAAPARTCGCASMKLKSVGNSTLGDDRRGPPAQPPQPAPLGEDPAYVALNFEIEATLKDGSNPELCVEGQEAKGTQHNNGVASNKKACTAGLTHLGVCEKNSDCNSNLCVGGVRNGEPCEGYTSRLDCYMGHGACQAQNDGKCEEFPLNGAKRGTDGYSKPYDDKDPEAHGIKVHSAKNKTVAWFDSVGLQKSERKDVNFNLDNEGDFLAFVRGPAGACSCHFKVKLDWDGSKHAFKAGTITKVDDAESQSCTQN
jgi:hypothetical protein